MHQFFRRFAHATAAAVGAPWAFFLAFGIVVIWAATGPAFGYSDSWQLVINTGTTIVTFLMVFLIQNTQNREIRVTQLKLDELIRAVEQARNRLVAMEEMSDEELERLEQEFHTLHAEAGQLRRQRHKRRTPPRDGVR
jgi:low affinity Fe/Cu permease